jgi:prophage regulatory protein
MTDSDDGALETPRQVAELLSISLPTLWRWVREGRLPKPIRIGPQKVGFLRSERLAFVRAQAAKRDRVLPRRNPNPRVGARK